MIAARTGMALALALTACAATQGHAQNWRMDLGVNGGGSLLTSGLDEDQLGVTGGVEMDGGWLAGAQSTFWFTRHFGLRANFAYTNRALSFDGDETLVGDNINLIEDVNLWTGTGDIMLRLAAPSDRFMGPRLLPYLTGGIGARWVNPPGDNFALDFDPSRSGEVFAVADDAYFLEEKVVPVYRAGLGADARMSENMAFRFELGDMMWQPPIHSVEDVAGTDVAISDDDIGDLQHELYATLGIHILIGLDRGERVAATLGAPPAPQRERPSHQPVSVCVADPAVSSQGVVIVRAMVEPATGDTLIDDGGRMVPIRELVRSHDGAHAADGLLFETGPELLAYSPSGEPRAIADGLVYLGRVRSLPVYTTQSAISQLQPHLEDARHARDLSEWLRNDEANVRTFRAEVAQIYVPVTSVGCVFQPMQQVGS